MAEEDRIDMDDEDEGGESAGASSGGGAGLGKIIKILLYVVGAIVVLFLVAGISYLVSKYVQEQSYQREQDIVVAPPPAPLAHFDLPSFAVTTKDEEPHFAKVTVSLGYEDNVELNSELVKRTVQIQHLINIILRGKRYEDLDSVEDTIGLAEEIMAHVNVVLISGKIKEVYFREFILN
jgi:flagellar basal body-associated protein FliL